MEPKTLHSLSIVVERVCVPPSRLYYVRRQQLTVLLVVALSLSEDLVVHSAVLNEGRECELGPSLNVTS